MNVQVTYFHTNNFSFCHRGKSKLGIGLFIDGLLREPFDFYSQGTSIIRHETSLSLIAPACETKIAK